MSRAAEIPGEVSHVLGNRRDGTEEMEQKRWKRGDGTGEMEQLRRRDDTREMEQGRWKRRDGAGKMEQERWNRID
jgi:hypothetical protein